jgi:CRP-like cAMP-binding protein
MFKLLEGVPAEDVERLLRAGRRRTYSANEVIFHQDDPADSLHLIRSGRIAVSSSTPDGDQVIFAISGPGDIMGEIALLSSAGVRTGTATALEPVETISIHRDEFGRLRRAHPAVTDVLVNILTERVTRLSEHLLEGLYLPAEVRVIRRLLALAKTYGDGADGSAIPLRQADLAFLAGTARATVNRVLREEESRGTVRLERQRVIIIDIKRLTARVSDEAVGGYPG